ncbi:MAG: 8-amino-7-oxononanoate synthase [Myxococcales bacterium]|nr:8-amino-7-oxononanoate synthase [Myxococcales bacterium]
MSPFLQDLTAELANLENAQRLRTNPALAGDDRIHFTRDGGPLLAFASNDYLGLASHPALAQAATLSSQDGFGAGAARLISGDLPPHRHLEQAIASFLALPDCLLFSTGYQANLAVLTALAGPDDLVVSDRANHASIIDGCRLSRAQVKIYPHGDPAAARDALQSPGSFRRRLLVTESLFSMDGDLAPLRDLSTAAAQSGAVLVVDEAHALGVLGPGGRGVCPAQGVVPDVTIGTLGKAFGAFGGFVAGQAPLRQFLLNRARTFIFTTALPPPVAAAASAGVALAGGPEGERRRQRLNINRALLQERLHSTRLLPAGDMPGPIFPILLGADARALTVARALAQQGILAPAIRPPTVPEGAARLRITLSADHTAAEIHRLADALQDLAA